MPLSQCVTQVTPFLILLTLAWPLIASSVLPALPARALPAGMPASAAVLFPAVHPCTASGENPGLVTYPALLHSQGNLEEAVPVYEEALRLWTGQHAVITFSLANALIQLGR